MTASSSVIAQSASTAVGARPAAPRTYKYYEFVLAAFVTVLLCSNVIGAAKIVTLGGFTFGAGILFFPLSYIFGDILTEVYGYARARRVVWAGFGALRYASMMAWGIVTLPPARDWPNQAATKWPSAPRRGSRVLAGGLFAGEFTNSITTGTRISRPSPYRRNRQTEGRGDAANIVHGHHQAGSQPDIEEVE